MKRLEEKDLIGKVYSRLTIIKEAESIKRKRYFLCKCLCGNETIVYLDHIRRGRTNSCGCLKKEETGKRFKKLPQDKQTREKNKERDKVKRRAQQMVRYYLKAGEIVKKNSCEICKQEERLLAHHEDYSKPLDVNWLCWGCHKNLHLGKVNIPN